MHIELDQIKAIVNKSDLHLVRLSHRVEGILVEVEDEGSGDITLILDCIVIDSAVWM